MSVVLSSPGHPTQGWQKRAYAGLNRSANRASLGEQTRRGCDLGSQEPDVKRRSSTERTVASLVDVSSDGGLLANKSGVSETAARCGEAGLWIAQLLVWSRRAGVWANRDLYSVRLAKVG